MVNYKKLKSQIHRSEAGPSTGHVFLPTVQQTKDSHYQIFPIYVRGSKRSAIKNIVKIIYSQRMSHWRKEFLL